LEKIGIWKIKNKMVTKKKTSKKKKPTFGSYLWKQTKMGLKRGTSIGKEGYIKSKILANKGLDIADKVTIGVEKADSGFNLGNLVTVTNGMYKGQPLTITAFVKGGIQGRLTNGQVILLRHGSYKDYYMTSSIKKMSPRKMNVTKLERYY